MSEQLKQDLDLIHKHCAASLCPEHFEAWERIAAALNAQAGVVEAARRYYEGWCQDEAGDEPEDGSDRCRWTGCTVEQRDAARALRDALAAVKGVDRG